MIHRYATAVGCLTIVMQGAAHAQTNSAQAPEQAQIQAGGLEDIIVTARRRTESLQSVPVAASAFSSQTIERQSMTDIRAFAQTVPSLKITQSGSSSSASIVNIRGQEGNNISMAFDPAVGVYIDEVYLGRTLGNQLSTLQDVEGVEVLRGVQGTLFGRNSNGGAIVIRPNKPVLDKASGNAQASYGSHNRVQLQGMINIPIIEGKLGLRASANWLWRDGFQDAPNIGLHDYGNRNRGGGRIALRALPTEDTTIDLAYDVSHIDERGQLVSFFTTPDFYDTTLSGFAGAISKGTTQGWTGKALHDFGKVQVKAIVAYRKLHFLDRSDVDNSTSQSLDVYQFKKQNQFSAELNVNASLIKGGELLNSLDLTAGLYYFEEKGREPRRTPFTSTTSVGVLQNLSVENRSKAAYAQLEGTFFDKLSIFGGARFTKDDRDATTQIIRNGACATITGASLEDCFRPGVAKFDYWSWTGGARYSFARDSQIYAKASRGTRSGGLDNNTALLFKPETVNEYEVGVKVDWLDRRVRTNLAAFKNKFKDIQRAGLQIINGIPTSTVANAASASIKGIEFEGTLIPVPGLTLSGTFGYVDAAYQSYLAPQSDGTILDLSDAPFNNVSKWSYSLAASYLFDTSEGEVDMHVDWGWRSRFTLETTGDPVFSQPGFGLLNGRISFAPTDLPGFKVALFGTNLTDRRYVIGSTRFGPGTGVVYPRSEPRIIGVEVGVNF